jgi:hypothetical protein
VLVLVALLLSQEAAAACPVCVRARSSCGVAANDTHAACRTGCRLRMDDPSCTAGCEAARRTARTACDLDEATCEASCAAAAAPSCAGGCVDDLAACQKLARAGAHGCRKACMAEPDRPTRRSCLLRCRSERTDDWRSCARQAVTCAAGCTPDPACTSAGLAGPALAACSAYCGTLACDRSGDGLCGAARDALLRTAGRAAFPCDCARAAVVDPPPPAPEPIGYVEVPLPAGVSLPARAASPKWTPDESRIVASVEVEGSHRTEVAIFTEDGSDFRCISCPLTQPGDPDLTSPEVFSDQRRIQVGTGQGPLTGEQAFVIECAPSILDCASVAVLPVELPGAQAPNVTQAARELSIAPDGVHAVFNQVRFLPGFGEVIFMIFGELVRHADRYALESGRVIGYGEFKGFTRDGHGFFFLSEDGTHSLNIDVFRTELATGETRPMTRHFEYDEGFRESPDGEWNLIGGSRGQRLFEVFTQVPRPGIVDRALTARLISWALLARRPKVIERYLVDRHGERGGYIGQPIAPDGEATGWDERAGGGWSTDGTRVLFYEVRPAALGTPSSRIRIATLLSSSPVTTPIEAAPLVEPLWAPPFDGFTLPAVPPPPPVQLGKVSGRAEVVYVAGTPNMVDVKYREYSDDGLHVLNGSERVVWNEADVLQPATWNADVTLSGCTPGYFRARDLEVSPLAASGEVESAVGDNVVHGLP